MFRNANAQNKKKKKKKLNNAFRWSVICIHPLHFMNFVSLNIILRMILSLMDVNVLNDHLHQLCLLIDSMLCGGCVSSDEGCLSPRAPTGADVSFFSTLGCSLRGALTSGSMALALLSPFIWSERALAPVPVCRWPSFHLASSLSLSSPDSWLPQPAADRRQVLGLHKRMHALHKHTHRRGEWLVMHLDADATHPHFVFFCFFFHFLLSLTLPPSTVSPPPSARLSLPLSLSVWVFQPLPLVSGVTKEQII